MSNRLRHRSLVDVTFEYEFISFIASLSKHSFRLKRHLLNHTSPIYNKINNKNNSICYRIENNFFQYISKQSTERLSLSHSNQFFRSTVNNGAL